MGHGLASVAGPVLTVSNKALDPVRAHFPADQTRQPSLALTSGKELEAEGEASKCKGPKVRACSGWQEQGEQGSQWQEVRLEK